MELMDCSVMSSVVAVLIHIHSLASGNGSFYYILTNSCDLSLIENGAP